MDGLAIAAGPLGRAGLGALGANFPGGRALPIRLDAALGIVAEPAAQRVAADAAEPAGPIVTMRATRP